jgi:hypothetical protein
MGRPPKLTAAHQAEARRRRAEGATLAQLARSYDVGKSTISRLNRLQIENFLMDHTSVTQERLLAEVEDLLRTMPPEATIRHDTPENFSWLGRAAAIIENWSQPKGELFTQYLIKFHDNLASPSHEGFRQIIVLLHQARNDLRMRTVGPTNTALPHGRVFDYFDEIRKIIELSSAEVFFVDPYLDAEFVSRYLSHVRGGVTIRLLTTGIKLTSLLPAVDLFIQQCGHVVNLRSTTGLHDRYIFLDKGYCYQSGASFKDGARLAPPTLTQITDAFEAVLQTYESKWTGSKIER